MSRSASMLVAVKETANVLIYQQNMFASKLPISQKMDKVLGRTNSAPPDYQSSALTAPPRCLLWPFQTYKVAQAQRKEKATTLNYIHITGLYQKNPECSALHKSLCGWVI